MCWLVDAPEPEQQGTAFRLLQATPSTRDKAQNRQAGFFTPNGKLWLIPSILDMETYVRIHKLITMKKTWSLVHKYSLVSAFSTFSFTEVHWTDSLLMQTNKGLDSSRVDALWPSIKQSRKPVHSGSAICLWIEHTTSSAVSIRDCLSFFLVNTSTSTYKNCQKKPSVHIHTHAQHRTEVLFYAQGICNYSSVMCTYSYFSSYRTLKINRIDKFIHCTNFKKYICLFQDLIYSHIWVFVCVQTLLYDLTNNTPVLQSHL